MELENLYKKAISDKEDKGQTFEAFCRTFFESIEGFSCEVNVRGPNEVDIVITNNSKEGFFSQLGSLIIVECKNKKEKIDINDINKIKTVAKSQYGAICKLAIIITTSELTKSAKSRILPLDPVHLVVIDKYDLEELFRRSLDPAKFLICKIARSPEKAKP